MRKSAGGSRGRHTAAGTKADRAQGRGVDQGERHRFPHRRQPAFYVPAQDYVQVPPPQAYFEPIGTGRRYTSSVTPAAPHTGSIVIFPAPLA
jgi:hypothetical protein